MTRYKRPNGVLLMPHDEGEFVLYEQYLTTRAQLEVAVGYLNLFEADGRPWSQRLAREALAKIGGMK